MNERDSEAVSAQLMAKGYEITRDESRADVVLLNTCSVRDLAEQKAIWKMSSVIGQARKNQPNQIFGFMGCMAQSRGKQLIEQLPDIDLVVGTQKIHRIAEYLDELTSGRREKVVEIDVEAGSQGAIREHILSGTGGQKAAAAERYGRQQAFHVGVVKRLLVVEHCCLLGRLGLSGFKKLNRPRGTHCATALFHFP